MIRLYHGSNTPIYEIDFEKTKPYKDFGKGFYLTPIKEQAERMARRVVRIYGGTPVVTSFDFDEESADSDRIMIREFNKPSKEWALFVINNRNRYYSTPSDLECNHDNKYDIVIGPVANDDLALLFRQFSNGFITVDELTKEMAFKELTVQYSFHSKRAANYLIRIESQNCEA